MCKEDLVLQKIIEDPAKAAEILETLATIVLVEVYEDSDDSAMDFVLSLLENKQ